MKISEKWLREWANPNLDTTALAEKLTMIGLEVEKVVPVAATFSGVVIGEILAIDLHPNADKLKICQVDIDKEKLTIVCGAANVKVGLKVPVAIVGAVLPGDFYIKQAKLRGIESHGMICSVSELGLEKSSIGIMELAKDAPVGKDIRDYLNLDDNIFEIGLTPNRGDCLSLYGIARDLAAVSKCSLYVPEVNNISLGTNLEMPVTIEAGKNCPHYVGRIIGGIDVAASTPVWMKERLKRSGINTISPVVDITNYVMLELGQPLHAFDLTKLNSEIHVRFAKDKESITLLDGNKIELDSNTLVIADKHIPQALAGVMGGVDSSVTETTRDIFLESAYFNPQNIAICAKKYGLHTDSSHRFERGVDSKIQLFALQRATNLIMEIVGGKPGPVSVEENHQYLPKTKAIRLRRDRIKRVLGIRISDNEVLEILQRLEMQVESIDVGWQVIVPSFRFDIELEVDLIEELVRIYGYDQIPIHKPKMELNILSSSESKLPISRLQSFMVDRGYHEVINYSFVDPELQQLLDDKNKAISLTNPISQDLSVMRVNLWPGLLKTILYNQRRQQINMRLFEIGLCFIQKNKVLQQRAFVGGALVEQGADFFDLKADVQCLLQLTGRNKSVRFKPEVHTALHPGLLFLSLRLKLPNPDNLTFLPLSKLQRISSKNSSISFFASRLLRPSSLFNFSTISCFVIVIVCNLLTSFLLNSCEK